MTLRVVALLCLAGCSTPARSGATSSGGEMATAFVETPSNEDAESSGALGSPPPSVSVHNPDVATESAPVAATDSPETTETTMTTETAETPDPARPATVRPTTILAPARSGRLRLAAVHDVIRAHRPEVTRCYQEGLSRARSLAGEAKVRFLIGPRGRVESAEVYESTLNDGVVEACILEAMRGWRFPRPRPRGSSVLLTYPYSLATE